MTDEPRQEDRPQDTAPPEEQVPVVDAETLFQGQREVWITHQGVRYRLRLTRRGRLILQK